MERQLEGDDSLLAIEGIGVKALSEIKGALDKALDAYGLRIEPQVELVAPAESEVALEQVTEDGVAVVIAEPMPVLVPQSEDGAAAAAGAAAVADAAADADADAVAVGGAAEVVPEPVVAAPEEGKPLPVAAAIAAIDDDGRSPEEIFLEAMAEGEEEEGGLSTKEGGKKKDKDKDKKKGGRDRVLIYDEELGRTVVQRSRKPGRAGDELLDGIEEE